MRAALMYMQRAMDYIDRIKSAEGRVCIFPLPLSLPVPLSLPLPLSLPVSSRYVWQKRVNAVRHLSVRLDRGKKSDTAFSQATWRAHFAAILFACDRTPEAVEFIKVINSARSGEQEYLLHRFQLSKNKIMTISSTIFTKQDALSEIVGTANGVLSKEHILLVCAKQVCVLPCQPL